MSESTEQYFGKRITRNEDPRLLTGQALFVDDVQLPNMLHVAFYRSPYAHARILNIDVSAALQRPGVVACLTAQDLGDYWKPGPLLVSPPPTIARKIFHVRTQVPLAKDKVRHVGEPVVLVLAESRYIAEDALDDIFIDFEPLPVVVGVDAALAPGAGLIHEDLPDNMGAHVIQEKGNYESIREKADVLIQRRIVYDRGPSVAMENRGVVAQWDARAQRLTVWDSTQAPVFIRGGLAAMLGLSESQVRVVAPFIGGGFGPKIMMFYPEEVLLPWVTIKYKRPVKWIEDRQENFYATTQERGQIHDCELALTKDGKILGLKDTFLHDGGAYMPYGLTIPLNSQANAFGGYDVKHYYSEFKAVFTNRTIVTPYRGAGRQHGTFVIERLLDIAAKELGIDKTEIRRRNLLQPSAFPVNHEIIFQDFAPLTFDTGNYQPVLEKVKEMLDYDKFYSEMRPKARAEGKLLGLGVVFYIEGTGIGPYEGARVQVESSGKVSVATGIGTQGQGHFTSFAQIVADQVGVHPRDVKMTTGDTDQFHWGAGTFASRGAVVAGNAIHAAAKDVREKIFQHASAALNTPAEELALGNGKVWVKANPQHSIRLGELAQRANPMRGAVEPGTIPGLESTNYFGPKTGATAFGAHGIILEVDPDTMIVKIHKYVVAHDCGKVINPLILDGQIHGGIAQGIGNSFYEQLHMDENGQLQNASFMDFLIPTALDVPNIELAHFETPSSLNPLGIKGVGEAGAIPVGPLFAQALEDALGIEITEIPLSPLRLWELCQEQEIDPRAS